MNILQVDNGERRGGGGRDEVERGGERMKDLGAKL